MINAKDARKIYDNVFKSLTPKELDNFLEEMGNTISALSKQGHLDAEFVFSDELERGHNPFRFTRIFNLDEAVKYIVEQLRTNEYSVSTEESKTDDKENRIKIFVSW